MDTKVALPSKKRGLRYNLINAQGQTRPKIKTCALCQPLQFLANKTWPTWAWLKMIRRYRFISCTAGVLLQLEISFDDGLLVSTMAPCCIITALAFVWPSSAYLSSDFNEK